jgi:hypothetical protein
MSFGGKNMKRVREKGGKCKRKRGKKKEERGKELRQKGHDGSRETTCCKRGKNIIFRGGG